ncbi:MAG: hypothetical protein Q9162_000155 [Coniocarpon cinnabarinum]
MISTQRHISTSLAVSALREQSSAHRANLDQNITKEEASHYDKVVAEDKLKQIRTPWQREGADQPPVSRPRSAGAMTKGKLLTTPARLLKLVLPLTTRDANTDRKSVEPLALLVHPSQPLSYLERLIQAELPLIKDGSRDRIPAVNFLAADSMAEDDLSPQQEKLEERDEQDGTRGVEHYSGKGRESDIPVEELNFVRWSKSTEMGDFIRDAARGREFGIEIESAPNQIRVGVPSFGDRTYYLRMRLRKKAKEIADMAKVKAECDMAAHNAAQRIAYAGGGSLVAWSGVVAYLTFMTDLGWDVMEPVTYLVGMAGVLIGYGWFLMNRREASYQSAMNLTVSRRQQAAYTKRGFNLPKFNYLVDEANHLRREIMAVANEYDVDWDERKDAHDESVVKALKEKRNGGRKDDDDDVEGELRSKKDD